MKRYLFFFFLLLISFLAWAAIFSIVSPGNWNDETIWATGVVGDNFQDIVIENDVGTVIIQNGDAYNIGTLDMKNGNKLVIESGGSLIIGTSGNFKNLNAQNASTIEVSGTLIIWGDLTLLNDLSISITGNMIIHGDYNGGNDAILTINGALDIEGDANAGNNAELHGTGTVSLSGACYGPDSFCLSGPLDTVPPVISDCPADIAVSISGAGCAEVVNWVAPTADDGLYGTVDTFISTHGPGDTFPVGTTTVTYTATDLNGNSAVCSFNVTVTDGIFPVISICPTDIVVSISGTGCTETVTWPTPIAADNCGVDTFPSTFNSGDIFPLGVTVVTYTATDPSGNSTQCSFNITVNDNASPVISSCPANVIMNISGTGCDAVASWTEPTAADNCGVDTFTSSHIPGDTFAYGTTTVIYTATDLAGNVGTCSFSVVVNDITPPVFDFCPTSVNVAEFDVGTQTAVATWQEPTATDNCVMPNISSDYNSGDGFPGGQTIVTYTATDGSGNIATCEITVDVVGNKLPVTSPQSFSAYAGVLVDICLRVVDPDGDNMMITAVTFDNQNGDIEALKNDGSLCFIYTPYDDFEGEELLYVTVCDDGVPNACIEEEVQITVSFDLRLTFYKAFTPNSDNINDVWVIENIEKHPNNQVMIFDRLGGVVYSAKGYNNVDIVWDGHSNQSGQDITSSGTYFYKIDLGNDIPTLKGYVELIR